MIFLLSPAFCGGRRAAVALNDRASFDLAVRLREGTASIAEVFAFFSGLYFRGKIAYARAFGVGTPAGIWVITPTRGLMAPEAPVTVTLLREFAEVDVHPEDERYRSPLERDARALHDAHPSATVVLLGSIATQKYVGILSSVFGPRLHFPVAFVGRGDMSRGALMLRAANERRELEYIPVEGAARHGKRPPRLERASPAQM